MVKLYNYYCNMLNYCTLHIYVYDLKSQERERERFWTSILTWSSAVLILRLNKTKLKKYITNIYYKYIVKTVVLRDVIILVLNMVWNWKLYRVVKITQRNGTVVVFKRNNKKIVFIHRESNSYLIYDKYPKLTPLPTNTYTGLYLNQDNIHHLHTGTSDPIECVRTKVNCTILELKKQQNYFQIERAHILEIFSVYLSI